MKCAIIFLGKLHFHAFIVRSLTSATGFFNHTIIWICPSVCPSVPHLLGRLWSDCNVDFSAIWYSRTLVIHGIQLVHPRSQPLSPQYKDHLTIKTTLAAAQRWSLYQGLTVSYRWSSYYTMITSLYVCQSGRKQHWQGTSTCNFNKRRMLVVVNLPF